MTAYVNWSWEAPIQYWNDYAGGALLLPNGDFIGDFGDPTHQLQQNSVDGADHLGALMIGRGVCRGESCGRGGEDLDVSSRMVCLQIIEDITDPASVVVATPTPTPVATPTQVPTPTPTPSPMATSAPTSTPVPVVASTPTPVPTSAPSVLLSSTPLSIINSQIVFVSVTVAVIVVVIVVLGVLFYVTRRIGNRKIDGGVGDF